jgi:hypothetical protein
MTDNNLRRWGAILTTGGLLQTTAYLFYPASARASTIRPAAAIALLGLALALPGLVAFGRRLAAGAPRAGWAGIGLVVLSLAALEIPHLVLGLFAPHRLYDLDAYHSGIFGQMEFYSLMTLALGLIVLAVAAWRSPTLGRVAFWLIVANLVVSTVCNSVPALADALHTPAPSYLLVAGLGVVMLRAGAPRSTATTRQPATTAAA